MKKTTLATLVAATATAIAATIVIAKRRRESRKLSGSTGELALDWGGLPGGVPASLGWSIRPTEPR